MDNSQEPLIQQAISEAKFGNKDEARKILSKLVIQEPNNAHAWYLLSQVVEKPEQAIYCLERVLKIQPDNEKAKQRIHKLESDQKFKANINETASTTSENLTKELPSEKQIKKPLLPRKSENLQPNNEKIKNGQIFVGGLIGIIALCCIIALVIAIPKSIPTSKTSLPEYTLYQDKSYEDVGTYKVIWEILVSPVISKESLNLLMKELYNNGLAKASGINDRPVVIDIKAYTSEELATSGMGQWIGWIRKNGDESQPTIKFNEGQLNSQNQTPEIKFGLTEAERKQLWQDIVKAEYRAEEEAILQYPNEQPYEEFIKLEDELILEYKSALAQKKGLSLEQLEEIGQEGLTKNWPFPPR